MVVASNFLVQNANMSLNKKNLNNNSTSNNNNNNNNNGNSDSEKASFIKLEDNNAESTDPEGKTKVRAPCCMLMCRDNSHPFQDRVLTLDRPVKIGRTVARAKASMTNAIFDCKVLSRHHALLWYKGGKFYLQDTKSSNGTFINNQRLSATNEQSTPREVCSGDIVQFGVNVVENTKNVQHGCIIATLRLYLPDGTEAKASNVVSCPTNVSLEDLYKLNQYLQEAAKREKILRFKLAMVQKLVDSTRKAADQSWKAYIDEDKLLSRIETVEGQLVAYSKNFNNDKIREELVRLQDEKAEYQKAAKDSLRKILKEKDDMSLQMEIYGCRLEEAEQERQNLRRICKKNQSELQEFATKYSEAQRKISEMLNKLAENEDMTREVIERTEIEREYLLRRLTSKLGTDKRLGSYLRAVRGDLTFVLKQITALQSHVDDVEGAQEQNFVSSELIVATLNKLNSMFEMQDSLEIDEEDKFVNTTTDDERLDKIRASVEEALSQEIESLVNRRSDKIEELSAEDNAKENGKLADDDEENRKEQISSEKLDEKSLDGAESDVTEVECSESLIESFATQEIILPPRKSSQRGAEEELAALREKCRSLEEQEVLLAEKYANLKNQCGDLLNATYMVPIQYVVPIAIALLWMLLEKIF